ncbi:Uncharacterized conserved protein [Rubritalea squalenifaciens DSM 18772]|uniref:Uncharacterized conserved protein n=1 Tax=Rubritalea squalenifaciens DSM 18772 TaxID=1123071 RepID=A0A1M6I3H7_9BACT|nr:RimK/LysX family protein [Rubritalea squalenifaciens]SHJ28940.1 Uncharacterized conserved protein [Rubritalea squalenifaciens DSM 18772]
MDKKVIGRSEKVWFPNWGIENVNARIDTGAMTSSLHAEHIEVFQKEGEEWIRFWFDGHEGEQVEAKVVKDTQVKSSNGEAMHRYFVTTTIEFADGAEQEVLLSLANRSAMKHPVLIGRRLLSGKFLVDSGLSFVLGKKRGSA